MKQYYKLPTSIALFPLYFLSLNFFSLISLQAQTSIAAPKWEVRAVWLTTAGGADWPKTYDVAAQKKSLVEIFETLQKKHFNTVFFQVRSRGNTFYRSQYEPWAAELTGTLGRDPGWDPLEFAIEEAHKRGMELHAWFNVAKVYNIGQPPLSSPPHILRSHPEWAQLYEGDWWVDMGRPEVRQYTENLVMELVRLYDLDGIHFDYIRYPGEKFDDWNSFRLYGDGTARDADSVTEGGHPAAQRIAVKLLRYEGGRAVYEVGSGNYVFRSRLAPGRDPGSGR